MLISQCWIGIETTTKLNDKDLLLGFFIMALIYCFVISIVRCVHEAAECFSQEGAERRLVSANLLLAPQFLATGRVKHAQAGSGANHHHKTTL